MLRTQEDEEMDEKRSKQAEQELTEAAKEARRAYKRAWTRKNPDKVKAAQARYWARKAEAAQTKE